MIDKKLIKRFIKVAKEAFEKVEDPTFTFPMNILSAYELATSIEELLKEQEESIPVSWLKEKLEGHPELSYAITDGIINVIDLWEGR